MSSLSFIQLIHLSTSNQLFSISHRIYDYRNYDVPRKRITIKKWLNLITLKYYLTNSDTTKQRIYLKLIYFRFQSKWAVATNEKNDVKVYTCYTTHHLLYGIDQYQTPKFSFYSHVHIFTFHLKLIYAVSHFRWRGIS